MYRGLGFEPVVDKDGRMTKMLIRMLLSRLDYEDNTYAYVHRRTVGGCPLPNVRRPAKIGPGIRKPGMETRLVIACVRGMFIDILPSGSFYMD